MADKVWSVEEVEQMTPEQRREIFRAGIYWDLDDAPAHLVDWARRVTQTHIDGAEAADDG